MRLRAKTLLIGIAVLFFASCQKEHSFESGSNNGPGNGPGGPGNNNSNITGDWDFVGLEAHTYALVSMTDAGDELKSITTSDYVGLNPTGTVKITADQFIANNLAYDIDTVMNAKTYMNNVLLDDSDFPFVFSVPPTSSTSTYVRNNADSITVTGSFGGPPTPTGPAATGPQGLRLAWSGDTLLLKISSSFTQTITQGGVPASFTGKVSGITKLKRR